MSLAVFPFKSEPPELVGANLAIAANSPYIDEVWAVAAEEGESASGVRRLAEQIGASQGKPVAVMMQERIGTLRPGKGDAMNTAISRAAEQGRDRTHFYDADITNFGSSWIEGAEAAADRGFEVVRHRFPRAATDAMITWMITRPALARLFPGTMLPRIDQPLGGEILLGLPALEALAGSEHVRRRSDWGIDTVLTHATSILGLGLYQHHVEDGKRHALYGSLDELREMVVECLDAASSLAGLPAPSADARYESDPPARVPEDLKRTIAYDLETTVDLLGAPWTEEERELAGRLPDEVIGPMIENVPRFEHMDADLWYQVHGFLLDRFILGDPVWEKLAFRLWLSRVLAYTTGEATKGFDAAIGYLQDTISRYERRAPGPAAS